MKNIKQDFILPMLVLSAICLFITGALAAGNSVTRPIIEEVAAERADAIKKVIFPHADDFVLLDNSELPKTITEVYAPANGGGFLFVITTYGYGGEIVIICGIDDDGRIVRTVTLSETETKGIATPVFEMQDEYIGKDKRLDGIDAVSGATITSTAYMSGIADAFEAFEIMKGAA